MAAGAGLLVDGVAFYAFLLEVSHIMEETLAKNEARKDARPAYAPGGAQHVPFKSAGETTRDERWGTWLPFIGRAKRAVGQADHSRMLGRAVGNALCPKGHGSDERRKGGIDAAEFMDEIMANAKAVERIERAIAATKRSSTHVADAVKRKRACNATYDVIDAYRSLFLVKHPSRGAMLAETKRLVAYMYANVMSAGDRWATGDEVEELRLRAASGTHAAAEAQEVQEKPRKLFLEYCAKWKDAALDECERRGLPRRKWMKVTGPWWQNSDENPAKRAREEHVASESSSEEEDNDDNGATARRR